MSASSFVAINSLSPSPLSKTDPFLPPPSLFVATAPACFARVFFALFSLSLSLSRQITLHLFSSFVLLFMCSGPKKTAFITRNPVNHVCYLQPPSTVVCPCPPPPPSSQFFAILCRVFVSSLVFLNSSGYSADVHLY